MKQKKIMSGVAAVVFFAAIAPTVHAATTATSNLTQTINAGVLHTDVRDGSNAVVASPSFAMSAGTVSTSSQQTVTGTFGSATQRISVDNPGAANNGFTLAVAATGGTTATWTDGAKTYPFNAATAAAGQLTINAATGTLTALVGGSTGVTLGTTGTFSSGSNTPITILTAASSSADVWNGYLTGVGVSQTIPAATPAGSYTFGLTQTVTAS